MKSLGNVLSILWLFLYELAPLFLWAALLLYWFERNYAGAQVAALVLIVTYLQRAESDRRRSR